MASLDLKHLWNRGRNKNQPNWYLKLPIPRAIRKQWPTKTKSGKDQPLVILPLDTGDLAVARRKRDRLVVAYGDVFARLEAGEHMSPDEIKAAVSLDLEAITERIRANMLDSFHRATPRDVVVQYGAYGSLKDLPDLFVTIAELAKREGVKIEPGTALWDSIATTITRARNAAYAEAILLASGSPASPMMTAAAPVSVEPTETISQAAEAWFADMQRDPSAAVRQQTLDGHKLYVRAAVEHFGDVALSTITRAKAADFLSKIGTGRSNRTTNKYATTLACLFRSAKDRGRFSGDNPFERMKRKAGGESYEPFETVELLTLFESFKFEIAPKHTPETALPWVSLIAAYSGMRLEEICQLNAADIREVDANGATVTVIDIHNGGNNSLKNKSSVRLVPIHSALVRAGLLRYRDALSKDSPLFPGLRRRASKGGKIGARVGELFGKRLKALGLKREGIVFHSLRHTVGDRLRKASVPQDDRSALMGHMTENITSDIYGHHGPGLKRLAAVVEEIRYEGLRVPTAS